MRGLLGRIVLSAAILLSSSAAAAQAGSRPVLAAGVDTSDWSAWYARGVELLPADPAAADEHFRRAARLDPTRAEPLYARWVAFHLRSRRRFERFLLDDPRVLRDPAVIAADSLQGRALALDPFVDRGLIALAYRRVSRAWRDPSFGAFERYARGDFVGAADTLERLLRRSPEDYGLRRLRALALAELRRYDEARVELDSVAAIQDRRVERAAPGQYESGEPLQYAIGLLYLAQARHAEAREAFARGVLEDASRWQSHRGLGLTLLAEGRAREAVDEYRTALELAGDEPLLLREYAAALSAAGDRTAAAEQLARLVRIAPDWAAARRALAEARAGPAP